MRPHKLTLKNVGPFVGETVIDFDSLEDIFLITGKTGSGKTTIFDALCFALYGVLPGGRRGLNTRLRSDFAEEDEECLVSLEFSLGNERYRVDRTPKQERKKKRGSGTVVIDEAAVLYEVKEGTYRSLDGKKSEADERIRSLIGLSEEEFSKIVLLPQGEFAEFLKQNTSQRRDVLRKLFPVDTAVRIRDLTQAKAKELLTLLGEAEKALEEAGRRCPPETFQVRRASLEGLLTDRECQLARSSARIESLTQAIQAAEAEQDALERLEATVQEQDALEGLSESMGQKEMALGTCRRARPLAPLLRRKEEAENALRRTEEELRQAEAEAENASRRLLELESRREEASAWDAQLEILKERRVSLAAAVSLEAELEQGDLEFKTLVKALELKAKTLENVRNQGTALKKEIDETAEKAGRAEELDKRWESVRSALERAKRIRPLAERASQIHQKTAEREKDFLAIEGERKELDRRCPVLEAELAELARQKEGLELNQTAARLALSLSSGAPCPVCGSVAHPAPAAAPPPVFGLDERIDAVSRSKNDAEHRLTALNSESVSLQKERKRLEDELSELARQIGEIQAEAPSPGIEGFPESAAVRAEIERLSREATDLGNERTAAVRSQDRLRELYRQQGTLASQELKLGTEMAAAEERRTALDKEIADRRKRRDLLVAPWNSGTVRDALTVADSQIRDYANRIEAYREERESRIQARTVMEARRQGTGEKAAEFSVQAERARETLRQALVQADFESVEALSAALLPEEEEPSLEREIAAWKEKRSRNQSLRTEHERVLREYRKRRLDLWANLDLDQGSEQDDPRDFLLKTLEDERAARASAEDDKERAVKELVSLDRDLQIFQEAEKRRQDLSASSGELKKLADDLSGTNPKRRSFDAWLLALYLEEVAAYATKRLERMSEGRYSLILDTEGEGGRGRTGLDLAVFDSYTGKDRPCATLSGGESFMASICLALGLADSIQSRSGGIRLDAVFIDEGFGSLDDGSLDRALTILDEIRDHRMVGLISHVGEMKSRIPSRIEILKTETGSLIR